MPQPIYVVGHRNPDTDAICAAIGYAELLRRQRDAPIIAARAGPLRRETAYLLERFRIEPPVLIDDLRLRVGDVMTSPAVAAAERDTLYEVGRKQQEIGMRPLPIVDAQGRLRGLVDAADFAKVFFQGLDLRLADQVPIAVENLVRALDARIVVETESREMRRRVMVAASSYQSILNRLEPDIVVVVGDRTDVQLAAVDSGVAMLVVTGGSRVADEVVERARARGTPILAVEHHTAATLRLIHESVPVSYIMRSDPPSVEPDDFVDDVRDLLAAERVLTVVDDAGRVVGVVTRGDVFRGARRRVVLVDHNERSQAVEGVEQADIIGVIDHHRVAELQTIQPPLMRVEPLGACSSLVAKLFGEAHEPIPPAVAGIMLGAILADTLLFKSPTTTAEDRRIAANLAEVAGVDAGELGHSLIQIASDVSERTATELVTGDFKAFTVDDLRFGVGVIETANSASVLARRDELLRAIRQVKDDGYASVMLVVTDIVEDATSVLVVGHAEAVARALGGRRQDGVIRLEGVYSRKKQVVPQLPRVRELIRATT